MPLDDFGGYSRESSYLRKIVDQDKIPHSFLFVGPDGSAKLAIAIAFAQYILCENRQDGKICRTCSQCNKTIKLAHPDLHFSFPFVSGSKDDTSDRFIGEWREMVSAHPYFNAYDWFEKIRGSRKQGNIPKSECSNMIRKLSLKSYEGSHKILLLWMPEYLNRDGNRILKLIEEPPESTIIILVSENIERLLPTILSRCQVLRIPAFRSSDVSSYLTNMGLDEELSMKISNQSRGNLREALFRTDKQSSDFSADFLNWLKLCFKGDILGGMIFADQMAKTSRESIKQFLIYCLQFFADTLHYKIAGQTEETIPERERTAVVWLSDKISVPQLEIIVNQINLNCQFVEHNANERLLFTNLSISLRNVLHNSGEMISALQSEGARSV